MITIDKLGKRFAGQQVLKNISLEIKQGERVALIGPSGSGKSTLLRCMKFLDKPDQGKIYINSKKINSHTDAALSRVGLVFQNYNLFAHMSVHENLTYAASFKEGISPQKVTQMAYDLLMQFDLLNKANQKPKNLSGGQKQRVAIARALMLAPDILLFDEPTAALDQESTLKLIKLLEKLEKQMTILVVTHELRFAQKIAERIIFMDHGQILCDQEASGFFFEPKSWRAKLFLEQENWNC
jgi:ABC-type polar amino acid transport system ATPase subunit